MSQDTPPTQPVTIRMIAEQANLACSTVSYALRNHPNVSRRTCERVQQIAASMGYQKNAYISTLMAQVHRKKIRNDRPTIAWVLDHSLEQQLWSGSFFQNIRQGAQAQAESLGYSIETFPVNDGSISPARLGSMLSARGIQGLIMPPVSSPKNTMAGFPFQDFACAAIGYSLREPMLHRVGVDYAHGMKLVWDKIKEAGFQRPGLIMSHPFDERTDYLNRGIFLAMQSTEKYGKKTPICLMPNQREADGCHVTQWLRKHRPDVVICAALERIVRQVMSLNLPGYKPTIYWINHGLTLPTLGIQQPVAELGAVAVDLVVNQIHRNERGVPTRANTTLIPYSWVEQLQPVSA